jgi:hypothetical protein
MLSEDPIIIRANVRAAVLLGIERGALIGKRLTRVLPRESQDTFHLRGELRRGGDSGPRPGGGARRARCASLRRVASDASNGSVRFDGGRSRRAFGSSAPAANGPGSGRSCPRSGYEPARRPRAGIARSTGPDGAAPWRADEPDARCSAERRRRSRGGFAQGRAGPDAADARYAEGLRASPIRSIRSSQWMEARVICAI